MRGCLAIFFVVVAVLFVIGTCSSMADDAKEHAAQRQAADSAALAKRADSLNAERAIAAVAAGTGTRLDTLQAYELGMQAQLFAKVEPFRIAASRLLLDSAEALLGKASSTDALYGTADRLLGTIVSSDLPRRDSVRYTRLKSRATVGIERVLANLAAAERRSWAAEYERSLLRKGMDVTVTLKGKGATTIRIKWILVSRPLAFQLGESPEFLSGLRQRGFKRVEITDGYDQEWYWTLD